MVHTGGTSGHGLAEDRSEYGNQLRVSLVVIGSCMRRCTNRLGNFAAYNVKIICHTTTLLEARSVVEITIIMVEAQGTLFLLQG